MLSVWDLKVSYGQIEAVRGLDLEVKNGEIVALIGPNGAGKSTTVKAIAGLLPFSGAVVFDGRSLAPGQADKNARSGLSLVLEGRGILGRMSVEENLLMGAYPRSDRRQVRRDIHRYLEEFPILGRRRRSIAGLLSGGEQQLLAIARALVARPRLLILDEPSLGLSPKASDAIFALILKLRDDGLTVLLVEQKARQSLKIADRAYLLENGRVALCDTGAKMLQNPVVLEAFLGGGRPDRAGALSSREVETQSPARDP